MRIVRSSTPSTPLGGTVGPFKAQMCRSLSLDVLCQRCHHHTEPLTLILTSYFHPVPVSKTRRQDLQTHHKNGRFGQTRVYMGLFNSMSYFLMLTCSTNTSSLLKLLCRGNAAASLSVAQDKKDKKK